jgi:hypothetical protein
VYRLMEAQVCTEELCREGMYHSIYATERFQGFKLPEERRTEERGLIGERTDLALEQADEPYRIKNRVTGEEYPLSRTDFDDLCRVHLYDWLEQVPRSDLTWNYRRRALRRMAERLAGPALDCYDRVFAAEQSKVPSH